MAAFWLPGCPITVPDPVADPAVSVTAGPSPVAEGTDVEFTLTATPAPAAPLTVAVSWSETGSFLTGPRPSEVTIPTTGTVTVSASTEDDGVDEADGTVTLTVEGGDGYTVGTPATAVVTVTDETVPAVSVEAVSTPVAEGTDVEFTLTATPAPAAPLTVAVSWSETGSFLTGTRPETVTIPTSGTVTVSASTEDDGVDKADGTVTLTVESGDGYTVGTPSRADVTVTDETVPAVSVEAVSTPVAEGADVSFTLTATPAPAAPLTVAVSWSERGSFLTGTRPETVTIPMSGTVTVSASTEDDGVDEADGTVTLTVEGGDGYTVGTPSRADVTVTDETVPAVSVEAVSTPVAEGADVSFTLTATPAPAAPLTVEVSWSERGSFLTGTRPETVTIPTSGTVTVSASTENDGVDEADGTVTLTVEGGDGYTVGTPSRADVTVTDETVPAVSVEAVSTPVAEGADVSFTLTATPAPAAPLTVAVSWSERGSFLTGTRPETVTIPMSGTVTVSASTEDDGVDEADGTVTLTVEGGDGYTVGTPSRADVTVTDETVPAVSVEAVSTPVAEGADVSFTLTATPAPAAPLTVEVSWSERGSFLTGTRPETVTIPTSGTVTVSASTENDGVDEADGTVTLTVEGGDGYTVGTPSRADVTVTDETVPAVSVEAVSTPVAEGADVSFTLTATPAPAAPLTVEVSWSERGSFLTGTRPETVTIPMSGTVTVSASTENDGVDEADGTVMLTVEGGDGYTVGTPSRADVTVTDETVPAVSVEAVSTPVAEGADVSFTLTATPAPAAPLTVEVSWSERGSFLTGTRPETVTIPTSGTVTVSASTEDDGVDEADGTVTLTVEGGDGYTVGTPSRAVVTVTDDDVVVRAPVVAPVVTVTAGTSPVPEGTNVEFTLTATPAPAAPLTVEVRWSERGSFLTGTRPSEVTIPTSGTATVSASTEDDGVDEADGTVTLTVTGGSGYTVGTPSSAAVTVTDDDVLTVSVAAVTSPVPEGTNVEFTLTATPAPAAPLTVEVRWSERRSFLTGARPSEVTIPTSGTATVSASTEDDGVDEADGTVTLTVTGGSGYTVGTPSSAAVTVTDDDVPAVSVAAVTSSVNEGENLRFTLTATPAPAKPLRVSMVWTQTGNVLAAGNGIWHSIVSLTSRETRFANGTKNNSRPDEGGTVTLTVTGGSGYTVGTPSSVTFTVNDPGP